MTKSNHKKLKVAIIGGSFDSTISKTHLRSMLSSNRFEIICGTFSEKKIKNKKNSDFWNIPLNKVYNNFKTMINFEYKNFDTAIVLTPPNFRVNIYKELIIRKKNIICEKPIGGDFNILKKNYQNFKKFNKNFYTTYNYLGYPSIMEIKDQISKIGKIKNFIVEMPQQGSILNPNLIKNWRTKDKSIPNIYLDLGSHLIAFLYFFFNKFPKIVRTVEQKNLKKNYVDNVYSWLNYNNFFGTVWFSKNALGNKNNISIRIYGEKGSLRWSHEKSETIYLYDLEGNCRKLERGTKGLKYLNQKNYYTYSPGHPFGFLDGFINLYEEIYSNIKNKKKSKYMFNLNENFNIINILNEMHKSSKTNNWRKIKLLK